MENGWGEILEMENNLLANFSHLNTKAVEINFYCFFVTLLSTTCLILFTGMIPTVMSYIHICNYDF